MTSMLKESHHAPISLLHRLFGIQVIVRRLFPVTEDHASSSLQSAVWKVSTGLRYWFIHERHSRQRSMPSILRFTYPVSAKSTRLYICELDIPLRLYLLGDGLRKSLYCPLRRTVDGKERHANLSTDGSNILDLASARLVDFSHDLQRFVGHTKQAPEVYLYHKVSTYSVVDPPAQHTRLKLCTSLFLRNAFELSRQTVAGVVYLHEFSYALASEWTEV